jgi:hypothetical protein
MTVSAGTIASVAGHHAHRRLAPTAEGRRARHIYRI